MPTQGTFYIPESRNDLNSELSFERACPGDHPVFGFSMFCTDTAINVARGKRGVYKNLTEMSDTRSAHACSAKNRWPIQGLRCRRGQRDWLSEHSVGILAYLSVRLRPYRRNRRHVVCSNSSSSNTISRPACTTHRLQFKRLPNESLETDRRTRVSVTFTLKPRDVDDCKRHDGIEKTLSFTENRFRRRKTLQTRFTRWRHRRDYRVIIRYVSKT